MSTAPPRSRRSLACQTGSSFRPGLLVRLQHAVYGTEVHLPLPHASLLKGGRKTRWPGCSTVPASVLSFRACGPKQFQHDASRLRAQVMCNTWLLCNNGPTGLAQPRLIAFTPTILCPLWKSEAQYGRSPHLELNQVNNK